jgi:hypothetical protein
MVFGRFWDDLEAQNKFMAYSIIYNKFEFSKPIFNTLCRLILKDGDTCIAMKTIVNDSTLWGTNKPFRLSVRDNEVLGWCYFDEQKEN